MPSRPENRPSNKLTKNILATAIALTALVIGFFILNFSKLPISHSTNEWGQFGDYIGGTLNPILSFLALITLLYTIRLQLKELEFTREILDATRIELAETKEIHSQQSKIMSKQSKQLMAQHFESILFSNIEAFRQLFQELKTITDIEGTPFISILNENYIRMVNNNQNIPMYFSVLERVSSDLGNSYVESLEIIADLISTSDIETPEYYARVVAANLTQEQKNIAYIGCNNNIDATTNLRGSNIGKYLFRNVPKPNDSIREIFGWEAHNLVFSFPNQARF